MAGTGSGSGSGRFLYELPAWLVCGLCRLMDALDRADWERFASRIARDQVELRLCEGTDGRTQRLLWAWTNRNARVGELLALLDELELYRARDLLASSPVYEDLERLQKSLPWDPPSIPQGDSLPRAPELLPNQPVESDESLSEEGGSWLGVAPSLHPQIHINPARQRIMERLALYQQGALDSLGVLASELPAGSAPRLPEESDDFEP
ncbi:unnamed protein product [Eretmochelys imbricata]